MVAKWSTKVKASEIQGLLPEVVGRTAQPGSLLGTILVLMEELHAPDEEILDDLPSHFNPYRAPDEFVTYLAAWVDLDRLLDEGARGLGFREDTAPSTGLGRLRELIAAAASLSKWRGTAEGLVRFLEMATGQPGFAVSQVMDASGRAIPFHVRVSMPAAARPYRSLVERIVEMEKPAYVTYELV